MQDLILRLWPGLTIALALGCALCVTGRTARKAGGTSWVLAGVAMVLVGTGAALAWRGCLPGAPGLWLDAALCHAAAYGVGCVLGYGVRLARGCRGPDSAPA